MKLGLFYRSVVEKKEDGFYIKDVMGTYLEKIAPCFSEIDVCAPICPQFTPAKSFSHYRLRLPNIRLLDLGLPKNDSSIVSKLKHYAKLGKLFRNQVPRWDILYIFLPGYAGVIASIIARVLRKPYFVYLGIDWRHSSLYVWGWNGMKKRVLFPLYVFLNGYFEKMVVHHSSFTLVHGETLQKKYRKLGAKILQTAPLISISKGDIYRKNPRVRSGRIKCLFVGALLPRKGLHYLIRALSILRDRGHDVTLDLVGTGGPYYEKRLRDLARTLHLNSRVRFWGYVPNGPKLLKMYRSSDIFALPTLMEGFPRVLYEAMSQGLPIVTTNVGGISGLMKNQVNALLVPPKNPEILADGIAQLITNKKLRERLIRSGTKTIREILNRNAAQQLEYQLTKFIPAYREWSKMDKKSANIIRNS